MELSKDTFLLCLFHILLLSFHFFLDMQEASENIRKNMIQEICGILGEKIASKSIKFLIAKAEVEKSSCSFLERFVFLQDWLCG